MGTAERSNPFNRWRRDDQVSEFKLYDKFQREVGVGDAVMVLGKDDVTWRVANITLQLPRNANDPPAHLKVTLAAVFINGVPGGIPVGDMIKVRDVSELPPDPNAAGLRATHQSDGDGVEVAPVAEEPPA